MRRMSGNTPPHLAAMNCDLEIVRYLTKYRADVHCVESRDETHLQYAKRHHCHGTVGLLLRSDAKDE